VSRRTVVIVALFFGVAYAVSSAIRGHVLAGIVTGALGAVLVYLVLLRVQAHNDAVRRRREREQR
jgi:xanthine/uracil permease